MELPTKTNGEKWNWETSPFKEGTPQRLFLQVNWNKPVTEEEFVEFMVSQPKTKVTANPPGRRRKKYVNTYRHLRDNWGFFKGSTK